MAIESWLSDSAQPPTSVGVLNHSGDMSHMHELMLKNFPHFEY